MRVLIKKISRIRLARFILSGITAALTEYIVFFVFISAFSADYLITAQIISFLAGFIISFLLNRTWVFASTGSVKLQAIKYTSLASTNLILSSGLIYIIAVMLGLSEMLAKVIVMAAVATWNYVIFSRIIFKT